MKTWFTMLKEHQLTEVEQQKQNGRHVSLRTCSPLQNMQQYCDCHDTKIKQYMVMNKLTYRCLVADVSNL